MSLLDGDPRDIQCKHCGEEGLHWDKGTGEWRLFDEEDDLHTCGNGVDHETLNEASVEPTEEEWSEGESTA